MHYTKKRYKVQVTFERALSDINAATNFFMNNKMTAQSLVLELLPPIMWKYKSENFL